MVGISDHESEGEPVYARGAVLYGRTATDVALKLWIASERGPRLKYRATTAVDLIGGPAEPVGAGTL